MNNLRSKIEHKNTLKDLVIKYKMDFISNLVVLKSYINLKVAILQPPIQERMVKR